MLEAMLATSDKELIEVRYYSNWDGDYSGGSLFFYVPVGWDLRALRSFMQEKAQRICSTSDGCESLDWYDMLNEWEHTLLPEVVVVSKPGRYLGLFDASEALAEGEED